MNKFIIFIVLGILTFFSQGSGNEKISFSIGYERFLENKRVHIFDVKKPGVFLGVNVPVKLTELMAINVKAKFARHKAVSGYTKINEVYFFGSNEVLMGKYFQCTKKIRILPQIGFGIFTEMVGDLDGTEFSNYETQYFFFYDLSVLTLYQIGDFDLGILINWEKGLSDFYKLSSKLNFGLVFQL